ncbi:TetR/AcrR family transcriptional regulator [Halalkalibacter urbisdiaboli]|uniref:TetR/AcrR family transcriptional regulator n=1 Tax=Halalkalibacter urbisdiaboli TaxID=1960589 RepID=UPI000B452A11|nr:TetR/AcrR family transcriptional regulator [Halalkalibacter urbisdiaboli]
MDGFIKRTEQKKINIEKAALDLLIEGGESSLRVEDIAKLANVSQVTIYNYYGSKQGLLIEVIKRYLKEQQAEFKALIENKDISFAEKLRFLLIKKRQGQKLIDSQVLASIFAEHGELYAYAETFYQEVSLPLLVNLIKQGREEGYIRNELSDETILLYMELLKSAIEQNYHKLVGHSDKLAEEMTNLFFYGILNKKEENQ